jgi:Cu2+-containing amine oxidase
VVAILNLTKKQVLDVTDSGVVPISKDKGSFDEKSNAPLPCPVAADLSAPAPAFCGRERRRVGQLALHFGLDPRGGLVLHRVRWVDATGEGIRSVRCCTARR